MALLQDTQSESFKLLNISKNILQKNSVIKVYESNHISSQKQKELIDI